MKQLLTICLIPALCLFQIAQPSQQERYYTVRIPEHLVNSYLTVMAGRLDQVSAQDYNTILQLGQEQIKDQYRQYAQQDSIIRAQQKAKIDSSKTKKP